MTNPDHPAYRDRYPCACGTGYLDCMQFAPMNLQCCTACDHPGRFDAHPPYTLEEIADDMWARR